MSFIKNIGSGWGKVHTLLSLKRYEKVSGISIVKISGNYNYF